MKSTRRASKPRRQPSASGPKPTPSIANANDDGRTLLHREEAAKYLTIAPRTLKRWTQLGRVEYVRTGREVRYTKAGLDRWIANNTTPAKVR